MTALVIDCSLDVKHFKQFSEMYFKLHNLHKLFSLL